jgi:hypothetical protein
MSIQISVAGWLLHSKATHKVRVNIVPQNASFSSYSTHTTPAVTWIGWGATAWLTDLNPVALYVRGHLRALVCAPVDDTEALQQHTVNGFHTIRNNSGIFEQSTVDSPRYDGSKHALNFTVDILGPFCKCTRDLQEEKKMFADPCSYELRVLICCV